MVNGGDPRGPHRRACRVLRFFHVSTLDIWYVISKAGGNGKVIPEGMVVWEGGIFEEMNAKWRKVVDG